MEMHWLDYVIMTGFLGTSMGIGLYHALTGGRQKTIEEFIMADRQQRVIPTTLSLVVSYLSALVILGGSAEMYVWGSHMWLIITVAASLSMLLSERVVIPWLYPLQMVSVFQYFELRFKSKTVRIFASIIGISWGVLYMGTAIFAPSVALQTASGFPISVSIPVMAIVCTVYTAMGGMKAVVWTDVFQFLVMMAGMIAVLIKGSLAVGGITTAMRLSEEAGRLQWYNFDPNPTTRTTTWGILGATVTYWYQYGFQQASFQRYTATRSIRDSRMIMLLSVPFVGLVMSLAYFSGFLILAYYTLHQCDPIQNKDVASHNELLGLFVKTLFADNIGFMGFFLATLYSGALSSVSSSLSGAAANTWEDILKPRLSHLSDHTATLINKGLVVLYGILAAAIAFLASTLPGPVSQICDAFLGAAGGPLFGMFMLGGIFPTAEWIGTAVGGVVSFSVSLWICMMGASVFDRHNIPLPPAPTNGCLPNNIANMSLLPVYTTYSDTLLGDSSFINSTLNYTHGGAPSNPLRGIEHLYGVSFLWYGLIGTIVTMVIGLLTSRIVQCFHKCPPPDENLMIKWREMFRCTNAPNPTADVKYTVTTEQPNVYLPTGVTDPDNPNDYLPADVTYPGNPKDYLTAENKDTTDEVKHSLSAQSEDANMVDTEPSSSSVPCV